MPLTMLVSCWIAVHHTKIAIAVNEVHLSLESWPKYLAVEKLIRFKKRNSSIKYYRPNSARYTFSNLFLGKILYNNKICLLCIYIYIFLLLSIKIVIIILFPCIESYLHMVLMQILQCKVLIGI